MHFMQNTPKHVVPAKEVPLGVQMTTLKFSTNIWTEEAEEPLAQSLQLKVNLWGEKKTQNRHTRNTSFPVGKNAMPSITQSNM